jgi:hypothetical protein
MLNGDLNPYWDPAKGPGKSRLMMTVQPTTLGCEPSGSFWVKYPYPLAVLKIEEKLEVAGYVCHVEADLEEEEVSVKSAPSSIIYCPKEDDDVVLEVERLLSAAGKSSIIVLGPCLGPRLAQRVLRAGANGIVHLEHLESYPGQGADFLSAAFEDQAAVSRNFLEAILAKAASRTWPIALTSQQRRFLELVVEAPIVADNIMLPKALLRAFLVVVEGRLEEEPSAEEPFEEEPFSNLGGRFPVASIHGIEKTLDRKNRN